MAEKLNATLTIKDNGSAVIRKTTVEVKKYTKEMNAAKKAADSFGSTSANAGKKAEAQHKRVKAVLKETTKGYEEEAKAANSAAKAVDSLSKSQNKAANNKKAKDPFSQWTKNAISFAAAGYAAKTAWDVAMSAINIAAMQKVQETTFQALTNSKQAGTALYDYVSAYARVSALSREELSNATTSYLTYAKTTDQLERMIKLTERLYAKDPTQGAAGAVFAMRELLSGDTMSIKDRFNMSGFSGETIRNFANTGDIEGMLDYIDQIFNRFGATQEVVDANYDNLITQTNIFASNIKTATAESATPAMETLSGVMKQLNSDMQAGKYQPFISLMANGMQLVGSAVAWVGENLNWLAPAVVGVTTALIVYKGVQLAAAATTAVLSAATNLMTGNFLGAAAAAAALVGGIAAVSAVSKKIDVQTELDVASAKEALAGFEKDFPSMNQKVPVEVANSAPISVKGEVEIEEESLRYMLDIKGQQWLAKFTTATLAPQNNFYNTVIRETADFDEFTQTTIDSLRTAVEVAPAL